MTVQHRMRYCNAITTSAKARCGDVEEGRLYWG